MNFIKNALQNKNYEPLATKTAKATIYIYFVTFFYMLFSTNLSPGFIDGALFFFGGWLAISAFISFPLIMARYKIPGLSLLIVIAQIALPFFATKWSYIWIFST